MNINKLEKIEKFIKPASNMLGGAVGAGATLFLQSIIEGSAGPILGGALASIISNLYLKVGEELSQRVLSKQQEKRIGLAFIYALNKIEENFNNKLELRSDDFFDSNKDMFSEAEEILEAVLFFAKDEYEELKLEFLGKFIANIAFFDEMDKEYANFSIKIIQSMTFRQICLLHIFNNSKRYKLFDSVKTNKPKPKVDTSFLPVDTIILNNVTRVVDIRKPLEERKVDLKLEIDVLLNKGLVKKNGVYGYNDRFDIYKLSEFGSLLYRYMELDTISFNYLSPIIEKLRYVEERY